MDEIIEYKVVASESPNGLAQSVNDLITKGFQPLGGVSTAASPEGSVFCQAMVKYVKPS